MIALCFAGCSELIVRSFRACSPGEIDELNGKLVVGELGRQMWHEGEVEVEERRR
jgi:hypothetical protein